MLRNRRRNSDSNLPPSYMKILASILTFLAIVMTAYAEDIAPELTTNEVLKKLNEDGLVDVVFWLKPRLMQPNNRKGFDPRVDPIWFVTIANHSDEKIIINKHWFSCNDWTNMHESKSGEDVGRFSGFPCKDIEPLVVESGQSQEIELHWQGFMPLVITATDNGGLYADPGTYRVTHDLFPAAELLFSITKEGAITVQFPAILPSKTKEENDKPEQAIRNKASE